ncbi:transporter [Rhodoblastus sp.]|jgi:ZIP family zinc transporter|uniref:ZIP family metal transporter n=1 Tax=Rhodoblastus sp. TaxID=1962975 RepID=UPI0025E2F275|nr:transporter [Rhodoblastus sp.]
MNPLAYTVAPVAAAIVGGAIAAIRQPSDQTRSIVQHLAAGVVFSAAAVEILPDVIHANAPVATAIGSCLGVVVMLGLQFAERRGSGILALTVVSGLDVFIDGLVLGLSFLQNARQGLLLAIALTLELGFLGLAVASGLRQQSPRKIIGLTTLIALALPLGAAAGLAAADLPKPVLGGFYAFGLVALLYLVTEELLTEAHEVEDSPAMPIAFFTGFLGLIYLEELL